MESYYIKERLAKIKREKGDRQFKIKKSNGLVMCLYLNQLINNRKENQLDMIFRLEDLKLDETVTLSTGNIMFDKEWLVKRIK